MVRKGRQKMEVLLARAAAQTTGRLSGVWIAHVLHDANCPALDKRIRSNIVAMSACTCKPEIRFEEVAERP